MQQSRFCLHFSLDNLGSRNQILGLDSSSSDYSCIRIFLSLLLPYLEQGIRKKVAYSFTGLIAACFVIAGALAWFPYFTTLDNNQIPQSTSNTYHSDNTQPDSDWRYYGRDTQGTRFSPANQITSENINQLKQAWVTRTGDMPPIDKK